VVGPWYFRFFLIIFFITIAQALPAMGWIMISVAMLVVVIKFLYEIKRLPGAIMDILDRLTNKPELERQFSDQEHRALVIDAAALSAYMKTKIVGQDKVIDSVSQQLRRRIAARRRNKPVAVFCFAGPPSVGKTYFAKVLAEKLYGDQKNLLFFDMAMYAQPHAVSSMFGQAKGYVGSNTYGSLTAGLRDFPSSIVLLDEFEKAHPDVHKRFLTAWNDGFITEVSDGARISTADAIFILTTNAAAKKLSDLADRYAGNHAEFSEAIKKVMEEATFAPEVL
jgi:ATP-dependent Clp protease ATP-binding subunit ClpA